MRGLSPVLVVLAAILLAARALPAHAASVRIGFDVAGRDYAAREVSASGGLLNREDGWLRGIAMDVAADGRGGRWTIQAAHDSGQVRYEGLSQAGDPLRTHTDLRLRRISLGWSPAWQPRLGAVTFDGAAVLAHQRIDRAILPGPESLPLTEQLDATSVRGVLQLSAPLAGAWSIHAGGELTWPLHQRLGVDTFGINDPFTLKPRRRTSHRVGASLAWRPVETLGIELWASREELRFGASAARPVRRDGVTVGSASYPGSRQILRSLGLRLECWF